MHDSGQRSGKRRTLTRSLAALVLMAGVVVTSGTTAVAATVANLYLTPNQGTFTVCSSATFVAEADDANGNGISGETITFTVTGANTATGTATTDPNGNASFTYTGTNTGNDTITATDQAAGQSATVTATWTGSTGSTGCGPDVAIAKTAGGSLFAGAQPTVTSAADTNGVELGTRFASSVPLAIEGIRFFKGTGNTGTHTGHLWSADGTLLASATFTSESTSGWQSVRFSQPVLIAANTTYVASYYAPHGGYAIDTGFFDQPFNAPPLQASAGVFSYGPTSSFPSGTFQAANYWVDVMYATVIPAGASATFTLTTTDTGAPSGDVTLTDPLPPGLAWTQDNPTACAISAGILHCDFGTLAAHASRLVHLTAPTTPATCGTLTNTAQVADANPADTDTLDKSATADLIVTCPTGQTIAGHIDDCTAGTPTTTEVPGGTLSATGPQNLAAQPNPLNPTAVTAGAYTMSATAPPGFTFVSCGSTATIGTPPTSATEQVTVPAGGSGVGVFYVAPIASTSCQLSIPADFNGTAVPGGDTIWFNSVFKPGGVPNTGATIRLQQASVTFSANGRSYTVPVPDTTITFAPTAAKATLAFTGSQWVETVPVGFGDNTFLSGVPFPVPAAGLPGGIAPVTWQGTVTISTPGTHLQWQWGAAVYRQFGTDLNALGVKPLHSTSLDAYPNGDQAGTPENFTSDVVGGARGGGGANATGSYSATGTCG